ncbi:hypothetical protein C7999DRAFT_44174 [Corynascus novoguineensis]|uniref:Zn(2)-C6 fungal-type domain-containing protein n=1 Tax=Corynascus novoguineensis TaxID=1126955 RepID=A0AAN7CL62_9PEZI|nr:hypothetical protein C7999DRAFT_44174 [Corynascus novoguineensis]
MATATFSALPSSRQAIVQSANPGSFELCTTLPMPDVSPEHVLIKVTAVAVNHCDYKMPARVHCPGTVNGCDFAGTVVGLGESVARTLGGLRIGDRVAGAQMGNQRRRPWSGAFTDYIAEKPENMWRVPEHLSLEEAASIGCAVTSSVGMALWWVMKLPGTPEKPTVNPKFFLVYGGSTVSGTLAIQLLKLSGYRVVTTCSPKNFKLVERYGAEKAFDYRSPTCGEDIRAYTKNKLEDALDIITEARTIRHCYAAIGRGGGRYVGFELLPEDLMATMRKAVKAEWVMGLEVTGVELELRGGYYRKENPELHAWLHWWIRRFSALYETGKLKPHPLQVNPGGLAKVIDGIGALSRKEVSAQKLIRSSTVPIVRRSACDQCRARRVQCLRAQNSTAPCARCSHIGAQCVTSAPGHPGRPRKARLVDGETPPRGTTPSPADVSSPGRHRTPPTLRDTNHVEVHVPAMAGEPASAAAPAGACRTDRPTSWNQMDGITESDLAPSKSTVYPSRDPLAYGPQAAGFWATPGDSSVYFDSPSIEQSPVSGEDIVALVDQLSNPSQLQGLLSADDELSAMLHMGRDSSTALHRDGDPLLDPWKGVLPLTPLPQCPSPASSLMRFREKIEQRITTIDTYYSDPLEVVQGCKEEGAGRGPENPAAVLLTCSKEFIDIIQSLTPTGRMHKPREDAISTEVVLLALSSYLSLMRLFDAMFHTIHRFISQMGPDSFKSVKVKSVLRIGGISSLQDVPLKTYATGVLDAIQSQVRTLERYMGIPTEYCLSSEEAASFPAVTPGILSRADREQLFKVVLAQEDVNSRQGSKSYVESIRASIQESMRFLND